MVCDDTIAVPFLTLNPVVPPDPIDTPMETLPPLLPTPDMSFISLAPHQAPCYQVASPFRRGGRNKKKSGKSATFHSRQRRTIVTKPTFLGTPVHKDSDDGPWKPQESSDQPSLGGCHRFLLSCHRYRLPTTRICVYVTSARTRGNGERMGH